MRNLILGVFSWVAEWERSNLIERTRNALEARKEELEKNGYFISKRERKLPGSASLKEKSIGIRSENTDPKTCRGWEFQN